MNVSAWADAAATATIPSAATIRDKGNERDKTNEDMPELLWWFLFLQKPKDGIYCENDTFM